MMSAHETFLKNDELKGSSDRTFGLVFAAFFTIIAFLPLRKSLPPRHWSIAVGALFAVVALAHPTLLGFLNRAWMRFSLLLQKITNPIVMGVLFFCVLTPMAFLARLLGKDPLRLSFDSNCSTYWVERKNGSITAESMQNQF